MNRTTPIAILLIEDDPADQKLIRTSFKNQKMANELYIVSSAEGALDFLHRRGKYVNDNIRPDLVLLDLNMPGMGGKEFMKQIKEDEDLKEIPIVVVTTSSSERDIKDSYKLQAAGYVHKPVTLEEFEDVVSEIEDYWFLLCKLPQGEY